MEGHALKIEYWLAARIFGETASNQILARFLLVKQPQKALAPIAPRRTEHCPGPSSARNLFESILHNIGGGVVGLGVAFIGTRVGAFFGISDFHAIFATAAG